MILNGGFYTKAWSVLTTMPGHKKGRVGACRGFIIVIKVLCCRQYFWGHNTLIEWYTCCCTNFVKRDIKALKISHLKVLTKTRYITHVCKSLIGNLFLAGPKRFTYFQNCREQENLWVLSKFPKQCFSKYLVFLTVY